MSVPSSSSPRNEGGSEGIPPTYTSPGYSASDQFTTGARSTDGPRPHGTGSSGVRLLTMHYEKESALTRHVDNYEKIECSARELFHINKGEMISIEANMGGKRMRIDPAIWADVHLGISDIWISLPPNQKPPRIVRLFPIHVGGRLNRDRLGKGERFVLVPEGDANVRDVKKAVYHAEPRLAISKILLWDFGFSSGFRATQDNSLQDYKPASQNTYYYMAVL